MANQTLIVPAQISVRTFCRFAVFDTFYRQKRWRAPALFGILMLAFALVCFAFRDGRDGAVLQGVVLLAVGLGLPAVYVISFLLSVRKQGRHMGLDGVRTAYTLHLRDEGIQVVSDKGMAEFQWEQLFCVYRVPGCIYLYVSQQRAFLLPEAGPGRAVWALLMKKLPAEKLEDRS